MAPLSIVKALLAIAVSGLPCGCMHTVCDPSPRFVAGIEWGPVLGRVTPSSAVIGWRTPAAVRGAVRVVGQDAVPRVFSDAGRGLSHVVELDSLVSGQRYTYRLVSDGAEVGGDHTLTTAVDDPAAPLRFAVLGDSGSGCQPQYDIGRAIGEQMPDLMLHTGDVAYVRGTPREVFARFLVPYADLLDHVPVYPALGNHDARTRSGRPLLDVLELPANTQTGTERYYSFDVGACHFVALDSTRNAFVRRAQTRWLRADLRASQAMWKFVYFHHPPFSATRRGGSARQRRGWVPVFERLGVDVVFSGHDHSYQRTHPLRGGIPFAHGDDTDYTDPRGTIYIVTGGGGKSVTEVHDSSLNARAHSAYHFVVVEVEGPSLSLRAIARDGSDLDRMTLQKKTPR